MTRAAAPRTRELWAWALFDWATSPFAAIVVTFVVATYVAKAVAASEVEGQAAWGWAMSASSLVAAVLGIILGAITDVGGPRKPWLFLCVMLQAAGTAAIWFILPEPSLLLFALVVVAIANVGSELGSVFNNAILADLAPRDSLGRWSGFGWGLGYIGGLVCLVVALVVFLQPEVPLFGLDKSSMEQVRIVGPLVALWLVTFSLPLFLVVCDRPGIVLPNRRIIGTSIRNLRTTLRDVLRDRILALFLLAAMLSADGLGTLFALGGIYAAGTFGMSLAEVLRFGILLNLTAGIGAWMFAKVDDRLGARTTILIGLSGLLVCGLATLLAPNRLAFEVIGGALGLFVGPVQSAIRSLMARLAPPDRRAEMFGVLALTGRATSFLGPMLVAIVTTVSGSQRIGMAPILLFWLLAMSIFWRLPASAGSVGPPS
ncbi:MAG TPA: MFS transporter [Geminicoccus sp.]|jgi:UMF1 family MFS transporter|uniref:MFS transporter n=1 Tax=Geminicoccus sp. TaxID=2024832 RepID=UPI002E3314D2|nr:MFS transporter [Geminicoccus sp.]HEX2527305.1 MFS transporter [Geminicoccus sp.]